MKELEKQRREAILDGACMFGPTLGEHEPESIADALEGILPIHVAVWLYTATPAELEALGRKLCRRKLEIDPPDHRGDYPVVTMQFHWRDP